jgi:leader peptidase (prepilin peptidase)/N-methyltransferase
MDLINLFRDSLPIYLATALVFGLVVGSFLNVVIHRLPIMMQRRWRRDCVEYLVDSGDLNADKKNQPVEQFDLVVPRSACPHCGHKITALENIPIVSYLVLRGRCRECQHPISIRYPAVELLCGLMAVVVAWQFGVTWQALFGFGLTASLIALTFIDLDHQYLPDDITLPLLWFGLLINIQGVFTDLVSAVIGATAGYLVLWSVYKIFKKLTGKEGMGYGDFKLLAALGAWLGWQALPAIILLSSLVGAVIGISLIAFRKHERSIPIPFGPYLAMAGWIYLIWGPQIDAAYRSWAGL